MLVVNKKVVPERCRDTADLPFPVRFWVGCNALRQAGQLRVPTNLALPA